MLMAKGKAKCAGHDAVFIQGLYIHVCAEENKNSRIDDKSQRGVCD
jgi:hypothetical protein